eukprot:4698295-Ditylum_brightwellii.AAC.1
MLNGIKDWDDTDTNKPERDLTFLNKAEFVKCVSFNYDFRKAVHENTLKPILKKCVPSVDAGDDTVSALPKHMVPSYKMYKLHNNVEGKWIVGCPLGARSCPYYRQINAVHAPMIPHTLHKVKVTVPRKM